jgi:hypothetical protein
MQCLDAGRPEIATQYEDLLWPGANQRAEPAAAAARSDRAARLAARARPSALRARFASRSVISPALRLRSAASAAL